jgi:hypothetical protein
MAFEESLITDQATGLLIRISITTRKIYRKNPKFAHVRNAELNDIIAKSFSDSSKRIAKTFKLKDKSGLAEIRGKKGTTSYYISAIRDGTIDILTIQHGYKKAPKYVKEATPGTEGETI